MTILFNLQSPVNNKALFGGTVPSKLLKTNKTVSYNKNIPDEAWEGLSLKLKIGLLHLIAFMLCPFLRQPSIYMNIFLVAQQLYISIRFFFLFCV